MKYLPILFVIAGILLTADAVTWGFKKLAEENALKSQEAAAGTATDPSFQLELEPNREYDFCSIAHVQMDRSKQGKRIAFIREGGGKFVCAHSSEKPSDIPVVAFIASDFVGPMQHPCVDLPEAKNWQMEWLCNPKYPNLWVLGLKEDRG